MSRHYYAVYWPYGVNISNFDHEPIGTVVPFDTAKARDAYVAADRFDGNFQGRRECHGNVEIVG